MLQLYLCKVLNVWYIQYKKIVELDSGKFKLKKYWFIRDRMCPLVSLGIYGVYRNTMPFDVPKGSACVGNGLKVQYSPLSNVFLLCSDRSSGGSIYGNNGTRS